MLLEFISSVSEFGMGNIFCFNSLFFLFQDGKLTKEEIVDKYDLFVGSQATDFGEALVRHDEFWAADRGTHVSQK